MNQNQIFQPEMAARARTFTRQFTLSTVFGLILGVSYLFNTNFRLDPFVSYIVHGISVDLAVNQAQKSIAIRKLKAEERVIGSFKNEIMLFALISFLSGLFAMLLLSQLLKKRSRKALEGEFIDGFREVTKLEAKREQRRKQTDTATAYDYADSKGDIFFDGVRLPRYAGAGHALFMGASGSGKTQYINTAIEQIRAAGSKAIIVDPGGRYYARFGSPQDRVYSVFDQRAEPYDFWCEEGMDPFAISSALIEGRSGGPGLGSQGDTFFTEAAQSLFAGLIAISRNLTELKSYLFGGDLALIREKLTEAGEISAQFVKEERLAANVMASFATKLYWLKFMKDAQLYARSISDWVRDDSDKAWVFLIADEKDWDASKHYFRLILTIAGKAAFGRGEKGSYTDIYEIQDEIETIGFQPDFVQKLNIGRKDGYVVLAGLQAFSQFQTIYGDHQARTILHGFQNKILFRSEDVTLSKMMSEMTGSGRWRVISENISTDGKPSIGKREESRPAVRPEVFYALRPGECVLKISGCNPVRILLEYRNWPRFQ